MKRPGLVLILVSVIRQECAHSARPSDTSPEVPDSFKVMETFKNIVSISNPKNGPELECLRAYQTSYNPDAGTAVYIWVLQTPEDPTTEDLIIHVKAEDGGKLSRIVEGDATVYNGTIFYTDNTNCAVEDPDYGEYRCILWSKVELKDSVPQHCIDKFVELCGFEVPQHSRDLCLDGEGDY